MPERFFLRVYLRGVRLLDRFFGAVYNLLEWIGLAKPIRSEEYRKCRDIIKVNHPYPVNYDPIHKALFDEWKSYDTFENKIFVLHNVNVSSKGILFRGLRCFVPALPHPVFKPDFGFLFTLGQYLFKSRQLGKTDEKYLLVFDLWAYSNYFHWMVDSMCRLVHWKDMLHEYTVLLPAEPQPFMTETLKMLGVVKTMPVKKVTFFKAAVLHLPNYSAWSGQQNPIVLKKVRDLVLETVAEQGRYEKVFVSRADARNRKVHNEAEVWAELEKRGFSRVIFSGMSVAGQVLVVKNAKYIVTSHGANMTNAIFAREAKVLELLRNDKPNFCYWSTLSCLEISYYYQLCEVSGHDNLLVDIERFKLNLDKLLND